MIVKDLTESHAEILEVSELVVLELSTERLKFVCHVVDQIGELRKYLKAYLVLEFGHGFRCVLVVSRAPARFDLKHFL